MSGGHFGYAEYKLEDIADSLEKVINSPPIRMSTTTVRFIKDRRKALLALYADIRAIDLFLEGDASEPSLLEYISSKH